MPKQRLVPLDGGASFTNIRASINCHTIKVYQDGDRDMAFEYQTVKDGFDETYTTQAGDPIQEVGHGRSGILGRAPGFGGISRGPATFGDKIPAEVAATTGDSGGGDIVLKVKDLADSSDKFVVVIESESEL